MPLRRSRFCCFGEPGGGVSLIARLVVSESWITHLAWSPWVTTSTHHCQECHCLTVIASLHSIGMALLAYATADGGIGLLRVSQVLEAVSVIGFVPDYGLHVNIEPLTDRPFHPDKCGTTALQWISTLGQVVRPLSAKKSILTSTSRYLCSPRLALSTSGHLSPR